MLHITTLDMYESLLLLINNCSVKKFILMSLYYTITKLCFGGILSLKNQSISR